MKLDYNNHNGQIDDLIEALIAMSGTAHNQELIREMIITALRAGADKLDRGDLKIINSGMKELRYSFKLFSEYSERRKVSIFGSARIHHDDAAYQSAREFARRMVEEGFMVITGAGGGIMQAGNEGAGKDNSFGVNITLPFEQGANEWINNDSKLINFKYFFSRKILFVKEAEAIVMFPGGFGTHDEAFESLTLIQTGKSVVVPVIFIDPLGNNHWQGLEDYMREHLYRAGLISEDDMHLYRVTNSIDDAISEIISFYSRFHSYRFVKDRIVIRMNSALRSEQVAYLNQDFRDIVASGSIEQYQSTEAEYGEDATCGMPRLAFHFDRRSYGRLRLLIDMINGFH
ncbi:TIGR00730 family Rossman fold protein [Chrysiogenes arsenatis]|uniref:LOG family protein n=1 Tax=Chrysiogenes arsenatis TaxID=309797 RepID=UPI000429021D|nr:TIGR00730 family Rossman fold protein [Chrysiogenes arsenatis]